MSAVACEACGGKGTIAYRVEGDFEPTPVGNGVSAQNMGGWSTRPCKCVKDLPATDGSAKWWDSETIYSTAIPVPVGDTAIEVSADCEVPRAENGRRLHRTADNAFYPPLITLETDRPSLTLFAEDARALAAVLVAAADACDRADKLAMDTATDGYGGATTSAGEQGAA
jgi:hypothetical protein